MLPSRGSTPPLALLAHPAALVALVLVAAARLLLLVVLAAAVAVAVAVVVPLAVGQVEHA